MSSVRGRARQVGFLLVLGCLVLASACSQDTGPPIPKDVWEEVTLVDPPAIGAFYSLAFSATRGIAVGEAREDSGAVAVHSPLLVARLNGGDWTRATQGALPPHALLSAAGFAPSGEVLLAGVDYDTRNGFLMDQRDGWSRQDVDFGGLTFAASSGILRFAGSARDNNVVLKSEAPDVWVPEAVPFPGAGGDHGITDLSARDGSLFACGFDDGGDGSVAQPNSLLFKSNSNGWERLETPCSGCSDREFKAVAVTSGGGVLLGGAVTDFSASALDHYHAFLLFRSASGGWGEIVLPDAGTLDRVNDILIAANGDVYLACGESGGAILRLPAGGGTEREATIPRARIVALAESTDGTIWAAGAVLRSAEDPGRPALWKRKG